MSEIALPNSNETQPSLDWVDLIKSKDDEIAKLKIELQAARQTMREAVKSEVLREFLGDLSHDIRTPLSVIKTSIYLVNKLDDEEKRRRHLKIVEMQVKHLEDLVGDLVSMSRLDADMTMFTVNRLNINDLLTDALESILLMALEKSVAVQVEPASDLPLVMIDRVKMMRAIMNVLENAVNFTPAGGKISIRTYLHEKLVAVEITDTGAGIHSDDLPHVFDRFYRGDKARNTRTGSIGLGLAITRKIVERHQGSVSVESEVGKGTTFRIFLQPLAMSFKAKADG